MIERGPARSAARGVDVVCFDVGETLIDETRQWGHWADVLEHVRPAAAAGLRPIFLSRGPWAFLQCPSGVPEGAVAAIDSLTELPAVLARLAGPTGGDRA